VTPDQLAIASWVMCAWSLIVRTLLAEQKLKYGWVMMFLGQAGWLTIAHQSQLPGMFAYGLCSLAIAARGYWKARRG
jgi:hypothetical protein